MQLENVADIYPLSPVQQGMLFHTLSAPKSGVYIEQYSCRFQGNLRVAEFQAAWQQVIDRQPVLRTAFLWEGLDEPLQVVRQAVDVTWEIEDWRGQPHPSEQLTAFLASDRISAFDLLQAPISRFRLFQMEDGVYQFLWSFHHILADGWSIPILWQEVLICYQALCCHESCQGSVPLPTVRPYRDYIAWLQTQNTTAAEGFWKQQLAGFWEPTPLPAARSGIATESQLYRQQSCRLSPSLTTAIKAFAQQSRLTLSTLIQGAWALLLHHYSGAEQVMYGTVMSGRPADLQGVENMVGLFINTVPVRVVIDLEQSLVDWLQAQQQQLFSLKQYETTPLPDIQRWSDLSPGSALFESIVVFENYPAVTLPDLGVEIRDVQYLEQSNYPLALLVLPGESLELLLLYDLNRLEKGAIANLLNHLEYLLKTFIQQPYTRLAEFPRISPADQQQLSIWASQDCPQERLQHPVQNHCIYQLIEQQVEKTPAAIAVQFEAQTLTYQALNQRANQLAECLIAYPVQPGDRVAICLNRSVDLIVSILAVLKAGAAYVPLDPTYPATRLDYCLQNTAPQLLITEPSISLNASSIPCLYLTEETFKPQITGLTNPQQCVKSDDLAYIIYTSGSTGQPKGVMVSHRNLVHSTTARFQVYPEPVGRFLLLSSIAFDSSVAGIFWTLCQGGTLVMAPQRIEQDLQQLATLIARQKITHTLCVPTLYNLLIETANPSQLAKLHTVIVAGEACPKTLVQQHYAKLPATDLYNEYGPTEATVWCTAYRIPPATEQGPIPIGTAIPHSQLYLLDPHLNPVPIGAMGELYIGGDGITQGYLNQPAQTNNAFIQVPASPTSPLSPTSPTPPLPRSPVLYKTGDLARYRVDGNLEWLGRCDRQVKIRGYRIELGEIEAALQQQKGIQEAVVVSRSITLPMLKSPIESSVDSLVLALEKLTTERAEALLTAVEEGN